MWDLLFVTLAKLVAALAKPLLESLERRRAPKLRRRIVDMPVVPISAAPPSERVKVAGVVEPIAAGGRSVAAFFVRDDAGDYALVQPAAAAAVWRASDEQPFVPAAGDRVAVMGMPRRPDPTIDRELAQRAEARLVFAGGEAHPLFIVRLS